jgi:hypothetical protein
MRILTVWIYLKRGPNIGILLGENIKGKHTVLDARKEVGIHVSDEK